MSVAVRVIPCLDVDDGRVVKGVNFQNLRDAGDPVELAERYDREGADELTPTPADIDEEGSKVEITPVDASQTPTAYNQGDPAIINNNWLSRAGIDASTAVASDDPNSELAEPYINIFAVRAEDIDNPTYEKLVEIWQTPEVTDALNEDSNGTAVQVQKSKDELNEILDRLVEESK